jgi:hypothetical protein
MIPAFAHILISSLLEISRRQFVASVTVRFSGSSSLNTDEDSPLYRRIKLLGVAPKFDDELLYRAPLSQGAVAAKMALIVHRFVSALRRIVQT